MRKNYIVPKYEVIKIKAPKLLDVSGKGIGYGGKDISGGMDPSSRSYEDWDD